MREVRIEGHGVARREPVARAVDEQVDGAGLDHGGLAGAGLVHRRIAGPTGGGAGSEAMAGELGTQAEQRRAQDLVGMSFGAAATAFPGADDADDAALVET